MGIDLRYILVLGTCQEPKADAGHDPAVKAPEVEPELEVAEAIPDCNAANSLELVKVSVVKQLEAGSAKLV